MRTATKIGPEDIAELHMANLIVPANIKFSQHTAALMHVLPITFCPIFDD